VPIPNQIIKNFESLTGFPIVLNTSFNIAGEPVVLSPDDALTKFYNSGLEYLIIGSFLVKK
jgi:carbamoyltransferase